MATQATIEGRVSVLEAKVFQLLAEKGAADQENPWWEQWFGAFQDSPNFDAAMRRGAQYRQSQPNAADNPDVVEA